MMSPPKRKKKSIDRSPEVSSVSTRRANGSLAIDKAEKKPSSFKTLSIALPGSIMSNAQSPELRSYLVGQIARAATIYRVFEIVIFDDGLTTKNYNCNVQMGHILQYLECPQYLRKQLFPQHPNLKYAGLLNPLDSPHHLREKSISPYREGYILDKPTKPGKGSFINIGLSKECQCDKKLQSGLRVTVKLKEPYDQIPKKKYRGTLVSPSEPFQQGLYWGYTVRLASSLSAVFTECPFDKGYDLTIGTSERGKNVSEFKKPDKKHTLIVFGGVKGLETAVENDEELDFDDPSILFDYYLNVCANQGSRTIRTEEAILISLAVLSISE